MSTQSFILLAVLTTAAPMLSGCGQDMPTDAQTVRLAVVAGADHGGAPLRTVLTQEVTTVPVWAGDPDGNGVALITINPGQGEVCWQLSVADIALPATASHIHRAPAGVRGGIVVGLSAPNAAGIAVGCKDGVSLQLLQDILQSPESFYVNVHTTDFPAGAIRGQFAR